MSSFLDEIGEEATDFFEDFWEHFTKKTPDVKKRAYVLSSDETHRLVRPAYLFAQRIDSTLGIIFGISIVVSALTATFLGFSTLSQLLYFLIYSFIGRVAMFIIGISYLLNAMWRLMHIGEKQME